MEFLSVKGAKKQKSVECRKVLDAEKCWMQKSVECRKVLDAEKCWMQKSMGCSNNSLSLNGESVLSNKLLWGLLSPGDTNMLSFNTYIVKYSNISD